MKITEHRAYEILCWLDDQAGDHTNLFDEMTFYRDAAALIRQLRDAEQSAWHAGLDAGREQGRGKDHAHQPPSVPVGVEVLPRYGFPDGNEPRPVPCADGYWTPWHLAQQPAAVDGEENRDVWRTLWLVLRQTGTVVVPLDDIVSADWSKCQIEQTEHRLTRAVQLRATLLAAQHGGSDNDR